MAKPETQGGGQALGAEVVEALAKIRVEFHEHDTRCNQEDVPICPHCAMRAGDKEQLEKLQVVLQTLDEDDRVQQYRLACSENCGLRTGWHENIRSAIPEWRRLVSAIWENKIRTAGKSDPQIAEPTLTPQADDPLGEAVRILKSLAALPGAGGERKVLANGETVSPPDNQIEYLYRNFYLPAMKGMLAKHAQEHKKKYPWIPD